MAPKNPRRVQPRDLSAEFIGDVLKAHAPECARLSAARSGELVHYQPKSAKGVIDRSAIEVWSKVLFELVKANNTAIYNQATLAAGIQLFDKSLGHVMENSPACKKEESVSDLFSVQGAKLKRLFSGLLRIKNNSTSCSKHPVWLSRILKIMVDQSTTAPNSHRSSRSSADNVSSPAEKDMRAMGA